MSDKNQQTPERSPSWKDTSKKRKIRGIICTELNELFEVHDDFPVAAHLVNILRSKGAIVGRRPDGSPVYRDPYHIEDEMFLKELEKYRAERDNKQDEEDE